jgi:hypothetical protein
VNTVLDVEGQHPLHCCRWLKKPEQLLRVVSSRPDCQFWVFVWLSAESSKLSDGKYEKLKTEGLHSSKFKGGVAVIP